MPSLFLRQSAPAILWLLPCGLLAARGAWWTVAAACLLATASVGPIERLIEGLLDPDPPPNPPSVLPLALAACLAHAGLFAGATGYIFPAGVLLATFSFLVAWRTRRAYGPPQPAGKRRYAATALAAVTLSVLALLPPPRPHTRAFAASTGTGRGGRDDLFSGVILLAPPKPQPLRVPVLHRTLLRGGRAAASPFTIPFTGEYWFFYWPLGRPPKSSLVEEGNPTLFTFTSTDATPLAMQAHQSLIEPVPIHPFRRIDLVIESKEAQPETVELELVLEDSARPKVTQSLGRQILSISHETLSFRIPTTTALDSFDKVLVWFRLDPSRSSRSAQIAIDRFELIP